MIVLPVVSPIINPSYMMFMNDSLAAEARSIISSHVDTSQYDVVKTKKRAAAKYVKYLEYANMCANEEWRKYMMSLANGEIRRTRYMTYDNECFKCLKKMANSSTDPVFYHPSCVTDIDLIRFQEYLRDKGLFTSNEDKARFYTGATTTTRGSRSTEKKDKITFLVNYVKSDRFAEICRRFGVKNMDIINDYMISMIYMKKINEEITEESPMVVSCLMSQLRSECPHAFI